MNPVATARSLVLVAVVAASLAACGGWFAREGAPSVPYAIPPKLDDGWDTASVENAGIDRTRVEQLTGSIRSRPELNVHAVLIERDGRLVYEEYFEGKDEKWGVPLRDFTHNRDMRHDLRSVTKSVVSALVGIAAASGAIKSLDTPLLDYFPEYQDLQVPARRLITIRHALSMSAGLEWDEDRPYNDPKNDEIAMGRASDPIRYVLAREIVAAPGTTWRYNGGTTQVLGAIVQRTTGKPLAEYAQSVLWSPLGVTDVEWLGNLASLPSAASGLRLRPRDLAKFGSLYLHDGRWHGRQVVPADWVRESTRRQITFPGQTDRGYAYQWWHTCYRGPSGPIETPTAVGNGFQRIYVVRAAKTVVTFLCGRYNNRGANPPDMLMREFVFPALPRTATAKCPAE